MSVARILSIKFERTILGQKYALIRALLSHDEFGRRNLKTEHYKFRRLEFVKSIHVGKRRADKIWNDEVPNEVRPEADRLRYEVILDGDNLVEFSQWADSIVVFRAFRFDLRYSVKQWVVVVNGGYRGARIYPYYNRKKYIIYDSLDFLKNKIKFFFKGLLDKLKRYMLE